MPTSYNGWSASSDPRTLNITPLIVAGESFSPGVRGGDVHTVFGYLAEQFHRRVEPLIKREWHQADDWGYAYRPNRNANNLSCHASGTAIDINATRHPNDRSGTFTRQQIAEIREILRELSNVIRWGGDFSGTKDEMHFEIAGSPTQVYAVAERIRRAEEEYRMPPTIREGSNDTIAVAKLRGLLMAHNVELHTGVRGGFGAGLTERVKGIQRRFGLPDDGIVGPNTWRALIEK
jgi:peptidoglycan hydrolase-like protein with peptidoglycan-binding domain